MYVMNSLSLTGHWPLTTTLTTAKSSVYFFTKSMLRSSSSYFNLKVGSLMYGTSSSKAQGILYIARILI